MVEREVVCQVRQFAHAAWGSKRIAEVGVGRNTVRHYLRKGYLGSVTWAAEAKFRLAPLSTGR